MVVESSICLVLHRSHSRASTNQIFLWGSRIFLLKRKHEFDKKPTFFDIDLQSLQKYFHNLGLYSLGRFKSAIRTCVRMYASRTFLVKNLLVCLFQLNTQNMTNPTIEAQVKMEQGRNFSISGLKMTVKSGLEKIYLKFLHAKLIFF